MDAVALGRLGFAHDDASDVLRTMPPPEELAAERERLIAGLAHRSQSGDGPPPKPPGNGLAAAHLIVASLDAIRECHQAFGIADDISWETLSHLGRAAATYRREYGQAGVALGFWDWLRYTGWLYDVGRLQVTLLRLRLHPKEAGPLFWYDDETAERLNLPFRIGDPAVSLHVPANETLSPEACEASIARIRSGFPGRRVAVCTSWLLDDQLAEYLPADSNIIAFQRRFQLVPGTHDDDDEFMLRSVFGTDRPKEIGALPQETRLQRAIVDHLRAGKHWRLRTGWFEL
jgi:hypothetical protein